MYEGVNVGDKDFSALIAKMKEAGVTVIYWGGLHTEAGLIIRQARRPGPEGYAGLGRRHRVERTGVDRGRRGPARSTLRPGSAPEPGPRNWSRTFRAQGFEPEAYTLYSYAAVQVIAAAATAAKSNDPQVVAKALHENGPFKTVLGDLSYDAKGDPTLPGYVMYEWKKGADGKYTYIQKM
jgi:branched-chain amino acid transport system substrate-binding protein